MLDADGAREALWEASVRAYHSRRQVESRAAWASYHREQAKRLEKIAAELAVEHRRQAEELQTDNREETA